MRFDGTISCPSRIWHAPNQAAPACPRQARYRASPARRGLISGHGTRLHRPCPGGLWPFGQRTGKRCPAAFPDGPGPNDKAGAGCNGSKMRFHPASSCSSAGCDCGETPCGCRCFLPDLIEMKSGRTQPRPSSPASIQTDPALKIRTTFRSKDTPRRNIRRGAGVVWVTCCKQRPIRVGCPDLIRPKSILFLNGEQRSQPVKFT